MFRESTVVAKKLVAVVALLGVCLSAYALSDKQRAEIEERIAPAGKVCLEGDSECGAAMASADGGGSGKSGEEVYNASCTACHSTGAGGAPKMGDEGVWEERLGKGIEQVYASAINGVGGMPPKGTCMSCSDDEIKAAVDYMVDESD